MSKHKLINKTTGDQTLCDKITIDGFDYYVSDGDRVVGDYYIGKGFNGNNIFEWTSSQENQYPNQKGKVIATNNPNIDIPKVVDEVENICIKDLEDFYGTDIQLTPEGEKYLSGFKTGYKKSQETHPFSREDTIEFGEWCENLQKDNKEIRRSNPSITTKELLQIWEEQRTKIVYYG